jgi:rare lipoprotein A
MLTCRSIIAVSGVCLAVACSADWSVAAASTRSDEPQHAPDGRQIGRASWYGREHHGRPTASGARFDMNALTAAHRSLPLGTMLRVRNLANGRSVVVRVNDRGPFVDGRIIDLSRAAAGRIGLTEQGIGLVSLTVVPAAH